MNDNLDNMIELERPELSATEKVAMFAVIETKIALPVPSPYFSFIHSNIMTTLLIALMLTLGASGTVLASESAKPGDLLFPVERAREQVQLALAGDAREAELRAQFTAERLAELRTIISEETQASDDNSTSTSTDDSFVIVDSEGEVRIGSAVQVLLDYLEGVENTDNRKEFLGQLLIELDAIKVAGRAGASTNVWTDDSRLQIKDDRIEIREDGLRVRIDSDGEVLIKQDNGQNGEQHQSNDDDSNHNSGNSSSGVSFEAEADVFTDITLVEVEINDRKSTFSTSADTRAEVVAEIAAKYNVDIGTVSRSLVFEIEDRVSRDKDVNDNQNDDSSDDNSSSDDSNENDYDLSSISKFEVRVEGVKAEVRIEYGSNKKLEYDTLYTTKAALIAEVALKTGLATADLSSALDLEIR